MRASCYATNGKELLTAWTSGPTPEVCAAEAVREWLGNGRFGPLPTDIEWVDFDVDVALAVAFSPHDTYTVRVEIETRISGITKKEGVDA